MTTTVNLRKILDLKRWEMCSPAPVASVAGALICSSRHYRQRQLYVQSASVHYLYSPLEDGWCQIPSGALAGTFGAGACAVATAVGPNGTASAGSTTTLTTALNLQRDLRGYSIHITAGPGAGDTRAIASNTTGAASVITVSTPFSAAITASSTFRLLTPRWYVLNAGTLAAGSFKAYDFATNTWGASLAITGLPATLGTDARLMSTPSWMDAAYLAFGTGTSTGTNSTTTLINTAKAWTVNQWANSQVRIVSGTGAGQIRSIASNTATTLTVSAVWATTPDATSVYSIEGNDDYIYLVGNNAVTLYRYSISGNTSVTLTPTAARAGAPGAGLSGHWVWGSDDAAWTAENTIKNGRYLYSLRGAGGALLDQYDIALNTWVSGVPYAPAAETFTTGTKYTYNGNYLYIQKDATGRWFRYNFVTSELDGWSTMLYPNGAAAVGDTSFDVSYADGATTVKYAYMLLNTSNIMLRQMVI